MDQQPTMVNVPRVFWENIKVWKMLHRASIVHWACTQTVLGYPFALIAQKVFTGKRKQQSDRPVNPVLLVNKMI
jgi:hypothetical protein|tara:strand:+ start:85 stop:306 length:222 start_codon:yes stop_codon:yes gene_type:complete